MMSSAGMILYRWVDAADTMMVTQAVQKDALRVAS
jgi:hypothetical protein